MDDFLEWRAESVSFDHLVAASATQYNLVGIGEPVRVQAFRVTAGFFPLWGQRLAFGRARPSWLSCYNGDMLGNAR